MAAMKVRIQGMSPGPTGDTFATDPPRNGFYDPAAIVDVLDRIVLWTCSAPDDMLVAFHRVPTFLDEHRNVG